MMKKVLLLLIVLYPMFAIAQSYEEIKKVRDQLVENTDRFLTVKGIELRPDLKMAELLRQLRSKGLKDTEASDYIQQIVGGYELAGTFFEHYNCKIKLLPTSNDKSIVGVVNITFPDANSFRQVKDVYDELKAALSRKYVLNECSEGFESDYVDEESSDTRKFLSVLKDEAEFKSRFYLSEDNLSLLLGQVVLSISHYELSCYVSLTYSTSDNVVNQLSSTDNDL